MEVWKSVPTYEHYEVSNLGRIRSVPRSFTRIRDGTITQVRLPGKLLKPTRGKGRTGKRDGYLILNLSKDGKVKSFRLHTLVVWAFTGVYPSGEVRHLDNNKGNCQLDNLVKGTALENAVDKRRHGNHIQGSRNHKTKLTPKQVGQIRRLAPKLSQTEIAQRMSISRRHVQGIVNQRFWSPRKYLRTTKLLMRYALTKGEPSDVVRLLKYLREFKNACTETCPYYLEAAGLYRKYRRRLHA